MHSEIGKTEKDLLDHYGLQESIQHQRIVAFLILNL